MQEVASRTQEVEDAVHACPASRARRTEGALEAQCVVWTSHIFSVGKPIRHCVDSHSAYVP